MSQTFKQNAETNYMELLKKFGFRLMGAKMPPKCDDQGTKVASILQNTKILLYELYSCSNYRRELHLSVFVTDVTQIFSHACLPFLQGYKNIPIEMQQCSSTTIYLLCIILLTKNLNLVYNFQGGIAILIQCYRTQRFRSQSYNIQCSRL